MDFAIPTINNLVFNVAYLTGFSQESGTVTMVTTKQYIKL